MNWVIEEGYPEDGTYNATNKARADIVTVAKRMGFHGLPVVAPIYRQKRKADKLKKPGIRALTYAAWFKAFSQFKQNDTILIQLPLMHHVGLAPYLFGNLKKRGIKIIAILHDLELIRNAENIENVSMTTGGNARTIQLLKCCDSVVVHNPSMKAFMVDKLRLDEKKLIVLGVFDYVLDGFCEKSIGALEDIPQVIYAGNLSRTKSAFLYSLPDYPEFELYGTNYEEGMALENVHYHGAFLPDKLPEALEGDYALVWDGDSCATCSGTYGAYLKYNNPHKVSLYLGAGFPLIIWKEAALAGYVRDNGCGLVIEDILHLKEALKNISTQDYSIMKRNACAVGRKIRSGEYTRNALLQCLK